MDIISSPEQMQMCATAFHQQGRRIAFVPTMGNLHAGHAHLVKVAKSQADVVVVSIFVNPLQFGVDEDFSRYPRTLEQDCELLQQHGVEVLFTPTVEAMYPHGAAQSSFVEVPVLAHSLEGAHRPGHFRGVATVVAKLFHMTQPHSALFGEKDYQQLLVIRHMVRDLNFPLRIVSVPTVRDTDGLALSSRNAYLTKAQRAQAPLLYQTLCQLQDQVRRGRQDLTALEAQALQQLAAGGFVPDYVTVRDATSLVPAQSPTNSLVILAAARLGTTRLIDNLQIGPI
jgi:pantoate--beta-alanine ligase